MKVRSAQASWASRLGCIFLVGTSSDVTIASDALDIGERVEVHSRDDLLHSA
jgi:hypothetical protein